MKIKFESIKDAGSIDKERVIFKVLKPTNIGIYIAAESVRVNESAFSSIIQNPFWFPDQEVKEGDLVVLYTKKGAKTSTINSDNSTTYFYYWGLESPHTNINKATIVILETTWEAYDVPNSGSTK